MNELLHKNWPFLVYIFLILAILGVYWPVGNYEFVKYDDDKYVTDNRNVRSGLSWQNVHWAFTTGYASNWHPVTWLSHMLDCELFGLDAGSHHIVNLLFHIVNTLLLFAVFKRMTNALWASAFVAAVFALHPLHVESVAWIAERKDVLSTFFWMLTMWAYVSYVKRPWPVYYLATLLLFAFGLMAKPMLVTLPFVLLLLDYWPLGRMQFSKSNLPNDKGSEPAEQKRFCRLVVEKIPFFVLSVVSGVVTFCVQRAGGAAPTMEAFGLRSRLGNAIVSYVGYIGKMIWPVRLAVLYPHPGSSLSMTTVALCGLLLVFFTVCFIYLARRHRFLVVGWLWYIVALVPVIGLVQVGVQAMADRYTYIPLTGLFIIIAWGVSELTAAWHGRKVVLAVLAVAVLSAAGVCTRLQLRHWQNSITLFQHTIDVTPNNWVIHNNYASFLRSQGRLDKAVEHFNTCLKLRPSAEIYNNLGNALCALGKVDDGIAHYKKAIALKPNLADAHYNLALTLAHQDKTAEAIAEYQEALRFKPDYVDALSNLGFALAQQGKLDEAIGYYKKTLDLEPENVVTHGRLGLALAAVNKTDEAIGEFRFVLRKRARDAEMYFNLGVLLERQGKITQAIKAYRQALQINPDYNQADEHLKSALAKQEGRQ